LKLSAVIAVAQNGAMGLEGHLPWSHLPKDLARFKKLTDNLPVVMGRLTYESISRAIGGDLPGRYNVVMSYKLSQAYSWDVEGSRIAVENENTAIRAANDWCIENKRPRHAMVIGGSRVLRTFAPYLSTLYLSVIDGSFQADTYFPMIDLWNFEKTSEKKHPQTPGNAYSFTTLTLKRMTDLPPLLSP